MAEGEVVGDHRVENRDGRIRKQHEKGQNYIMGVMHHLYSSPDTVTAIKIQRVFWRVVLNKNV